MSFGNVKKDGFKYAVVFDMNDTLISKESQLSNGKTIGVDVFSIASFYITPKPGLKELRSFLEKNRDICLVSWSSMRRENLLKYTDFLEKHYGLKFDLILDVLHCRYKKGVGNNINGKPCYKKDLKLVSKTTGLELDKIMLIDDSPSKRVLGQEFYRIADEKGGLFSAINNIQKFLNKFN